MKIKKFFSSNHKKAGYFILLDMLIGLTISSLCLMLLFTGVQRVLTYHKAIEELVVQRNQVTGVLTSKQNFIQANDLEKDRSYEIFPGVFVDIYHVDCNKQTQNRFRMEKIEFGVVNERKGE